MKKTRFPYFGTILLTNRFLNKKQYIKRKINYRIKEVGPETKSGKDVSNSKFVKSNKKFILFSSCKDD